MCNHRWIVFSTALSSGFLMLRCSKCHASGLVKSPTTKEWNKAYHAPSSPYVWRGGCFRVSIQHKKRSIVYD
jgi:hypothetical protein